MKIGVSSYSFGRHMRNTGADLLDVCRLTKEIGFSCIEFTSLTDHQCVPAEMAVQLKSLCGELGLEIASYTVGADFLSGDTAGVIEKLRAEIEIAALLGAPVMRHDACWKMDPAVGRSYRDAIRVIAPAIREVTKFAESRGVKTCTENHGFFLQDSSRVEELMLTVDHPNYGWLVDIGNFACADEDIVHAVSIAAPYAVHVHAKDFLVKSGAEINPGEGWFKSRGGNYLRGTAVGHGDIPVAQCVGILKNAGYDGAVDIEFEGMEETVPALKAGLSYLRRLIED